MSLYTLSVSDPMPFVRVPAGLRFSVCSDVSLLAEISTTPVNEIEARLADRHIAFVAFLHNKPAAFGWMARSSARIGELNHPIHLPEGHRYLWNFRTLEPWRGMGIYPALLQYIMDYEAGSAERFWIIHAPENVSSLKGITKAGFQYVGKVYTANDQVFTENTPAAQKLHIVLSEMGFIVSKEEPFSCWNCSSPFLKKRKPECCCMPSEAECRGEQLMRFAIQSVV